MDETGDSNGRRRGRKRPGKPLDAASLPELALFYLSRFATSRTGLERYLVRKIRERGWAGEGEADVPAVADRMVALGYIDDAAFAEMKTRSMLRRGLGGRRIATQMRASGIAGDDVAGADQLVEDGRIAAALRHAERRRFGPFAAALLTDRAAIERAVGSFVRAGHDAALARAIIRLAPGESTDQLD
jgi:regulatory protein